MSRSRLLRQTSLATLRCASQSANAQRRFVSTIPRRRGRATGALLRWGLAGAAVYYYNTASIFADEPAYATAPETHKDAETYTTVDTIAAQRRAQARASLKSETAIESAPITDGSPQQLEEEAEQQGAFNEETGEINWDCPCLGGMAEGPCGEQFKAAFSCFVFSKEEPKGVDCIEHFKTMQNCFREHPDVYGTELEPDDEPEDAREPEAGVAHAVDVARDHIDATVEKATNSLAADVSAVSTEVSNHTPDTKTRSNALGDPAPTSKSKTRGDEGGDLVPRAWHNSSDDNRSK